MINSGSPGKLRTHLLGNAAVGAKLQLYARLLGNVAVGAKLQLHTHLLEDVAVGAKLQLYARLLGCVAVGAIEPRRWQPVRDALEVRRRRRWQRTGRGVWKTKPFWQKKAAAKQ